MTDLWIKPTLLWCMICLCSSGVVKWSELPEEIVQGQTLTIRCTATITDLNQFFMRIDRVANFTRGDSNSQLHIIAINHILEKEYQALTRYSLNYVDTSSTSRYIELKITDIKGYDGGLFRCSTPDAPDSYMSFHIITPLDEVFFSTYDSYSREHRVSQAGPIQTITLKEGQRNHISCTVRNADSGVEPAAIIQVKGNETEEFKSTAMYNTTEVDVDVPGIVNFVRTLKLSYVTMLPNWEWNDQLMTCEGRMQVFTPKSSTVRLHVEYSPRFRCKELYYYAQVGDEVSLSCSLFSNPAGNISVAWGDDQNVAEPGTNVEGHILDLQGGDRPGEQIVKFTISSTVEEDYKSLIQFTSTNQYGSLSQNLKLYKDAQPRSRVGAASGLVPPVLIILLAVCQSAI